MRYITNENGYIQAVSFNNLLECQNKTCTEYTGTTPTGYETLAEWSENANINAYKIVNGNLVFDSEEDARLQSLWDSQETGSVNDAEVLNTESDSVEDTYSCDYVNKLIEDALCYKDGDTYDVSNTYIVLPGVLTGSKKSINFSLSVDKSLEKISNIQLNSFAIDIRHADGGYIVSGATSINGTISVTKCSNTILRFVISLNEAVTFTNNTPVGVTISNLNLTFNE